MWLRAAGVCLDLVEHAMFAFDLVDDVHMHSVLENGVFPLLVHSFQRSGQVSGYNHTVNQSQRRLCQAALSLPSCTITAQLHYHCLAALSHCAGQRYCAEQP